MIEARQALVDDLELVDRVQRAALERAGREPDQRETPASKWLLAFSAVPGLRAQFRTVPTSYFEPDVQVVDDAEVKLATVACPCKHRPIVEDGSIVHCECQRTYLYLTGRVLVAFGDKQARADRCVLDTDLAETLAQKAEA